MLEHIKRRNLAWLENESIFARRDETMLSELWTAICRGTTDGYLSLDDLKEITDCEDAVTNEERTLYTIGDRSYWKGVPFSDDREMRNAVAAFNALRGRVDLIYYDHEDYTRRNAVREMEED